MSTDDAFYIPGQNHRCQGWGAFAPPVELAKYFSGKICKQHVKYLAENKATWLKVFKEMGVRENADKGQFAKSAQADDLLQSLTGKPVND